MRAACGQKSPVAARLPSIFYRMPCNLRTCNHCESGEQGLPTSASRPPCWKRTCRCPMARLRATSCIVLALSAAALLAAGESADGWAGPNRHRTVAVVGPLSNQLMARPVHVGAFSETHWAGRGDAAAAGLPPPAALAAAAPAAAADARPLLKPPGELGWKPEGESRCCRTAWRGGMLHSQARRLLPSLTAAARAPKTAT